MRNIQMVDLQGQYQAIQNEIDQVLREVVDSAYFIKGPQVREFEQNLAAYLQSKHVIGCGNGTDALQIALMALDLPAGSEIIVPDFTFIATAEVVSLLGFVPVFADVDKDNFNIDPDSIKANISDRTSAIIPVHLFGQSCDMPAIMNIAQEHNLKVVEDNAQAIGSWCQIDNTRRPLGTIGDIGCTSFFPSKNLGGYGDGGALFTQDDHLAKNIQIIANHGMDTRYYHDVIGVNSRLDTIQAAILNVKLKYLDTYNQARYRAAQQYNERFSSIPEISTPHEVTYSSHVFHQYTLRIANGHRDGVKKALEEQKIPFGIYYPVPLHRQEAFKGKAAKFGDCSRSVALTEEVISLPMHTELTDEMIARITDAVCGYFK